MMEGGFVATTAAITTTTTVATIAVSLTNPPKPVFIKIMAGGIGGTILGGIVAALILRHYRREVLSVATVILIVIAAIATVLSGQRSTELNPSQEAYSELLQKSQNLDAADSNFREYLTRNDYSSGLVSNPGLLQAVVLEASARYSNFVIASQNNPQNPAYNQHEEVINHSSEIEALKRINLGASGKEAKLKYVDPSTGSWVTIPIDSAELAASGLVKLNIISNSRREATQRFNLVTIAQNTRLRLDEVKAAMLEALRVKGLSPVASELEKTDWFGNKANPSEAQISDYRQDKPEPTPATPSTKKEPLSKPIGGKNAHSEGRRKEA